MSFLGKATTFLADPLGILPKDMARKIGDPLGLVAKEEKDKPAATASAFTPTTSLAQQAETSRRAGLMTASLDRIRLTKPLTKETI